MFSFLSWDFTCTFLCFSQLALLIAFLCVHCARGWPNWYAFQYFEVVTLWFFVVFLVFFLMHLFRLQTKMPCINWPLTVSNSIHESCSDWTKADKQPRRQKPQLYLKMENQPVDFTLRSCDLFSLPQEFFHYSFGTVLILIASIIAAVKGGNVSALAAGSVGKHTK